MGNIEAIKYRFYRAKKRAKAILTQPVNGYTVFFLDDNIFHIGALREREIRIIRICLDEATQEEIEWVKKFPLPDYYSKEIWIKKSNSRDFIVKSINP